jgi:hypothetical protein
MNRRIFLKGVGGVALATPFLSSLKKSKAQDASATGPVRRVAIFHSHNGCLTNRWFPKTAGGNGPLVAADLAGTTLEGLTPFVDRLLFPRGIKSYNMYGEIQAVDPHDQAMGSKLTCSKIEESGNRYATSHSMDHEIARQVNPNGASPMVLSVAGGAGGSIKDLLSFSGPGEAYPAQTNPVTIYNQLTQALGDGGGGGTAGFQPVTAPDSDAKMNRAGPVAAPLVTTKSLPALNTCPVGSPPGMFTLNGWVIGLPATLPPYTSLTSPWLDDTQKAPPVGLRETPQAF